MGRLKNLIAAAFVTLSLAANAGNDLFVLSGGAAKAALSDTLTEFKKLADHGIRAEYAPMGPLLEELGRGVEPDLLIVTADVLPDLEQRGWALPGTSVPLGSVGVGVAVRDGATVPDISTPEKLKAVLLAARSITYIDPNKGTSGKHFSKVLRDLGIADAVKGKTMLVEGGYVVEAVARGEAEIGVQQITEILPVAGVKLVGPLPDALQKWTTYVAVRTPYGNADGRVDRLWRYLQSPDSRSIFERRGFTVR